VRSSRRAPRTEKPLPILDHYEFEAPDPARAVMRLVLGVLGAGALAAAAYAADTRTHSAVLLLVGVVGAFVLFWTMLASRSPQLIDVERSIITIRRGSRSERFDLVDPNVQLSVRDGQMAFRYYDGRNVVVRPSEVDWPAFLNVVMHYQNFADAKAVEKEARFRR
jgi:hypothetical protein